MAKILLKTKDISIMEKLERNRKPGYVLVPVSLDDSFCELSPENIDIHGVIVDSDLITPPQVAAIKQQMDDVMFPVFLLAETLSEEEAGMWIACGVSDILQPQMPSALIARRIGTVIQLYCVSKSLHGQSTDKLTNLNNREAFYHFAKEMIAQGPDDNYVVILSDIENFKRINERFGEEKGDALLKYVGGILGKLNNKDILFARYGGDQFVGILRRPRSGMEIDENFLSESMKRFYDESPVDHFNVQFGIYEDVDKSLPISIMCDRAMMALKTIKHKYGRNVAKYTPQLQHRFTREQQILDSMEQAITDKQFQVYYQPKHDAKTSDIVGAEALVRWIHPIYGFLSPSDFIPLFEKNGFITRMDDHIWNRVIGEMKKIIELGIPIVPISVNASRMDFAQTDFLKKLEEPVRREGLDSNLLHLELTESVYMEDAEILAPILDRIKRAGIKIELDDFGSGFSSLGIISKLPVDIIKLDTSFVSNLETQPAIVESIVNMMHILGYKVTAEGVDNDRQVEVLRNMGCDYIQGYYYSQPLTFDGFCEYMKALQK